MTHIKSIACSSEQFIWRSGIWLCMKHTRLGNTFTHTHEKDQWERVSFADLAPKSSFTVTSFFHSYPNFPGQQPGTCHVSCGLWDLPHKTNEFSFQFNDSLRFLWFPAPLCSRQSEKVVKYKSFGTDMWGRPDSKSSEVKPWPSSDGGWEAELKEKANNEV